MRNLFTKILCGSFALLSHNLLGQIPKSPVNIQAPNAASFNTLADFKVSSFVGSPAIDIPLCNLTDGSLNINLGLIYNATGVRPDVHPGWVGLNMNLAVGGSIVRTVHDGPDDNPFRFNPQGFFYSKFDLDRSDWSTNAGIRTIADFDQAMLDTEPDEFGFNMMGISGKFYLGVDGKWKVQSEQDIKVEIIGSLTINDTYPPFTPPSFTGNYWYNNNAGKYRNHAAGFILTDENGTKYEFGGGNNAFMEYSMDFFNQGQDTWTCNAWYLKSVTTHTGQVINFTYERGDFIAQMGVSAHSKSYLVDGDGGSTSCDIGWSSNIDTYGPYNGKLISPIYLKEITSNNLKVNFISSESTELRYDENIFTPYINGYFSQYPTGRTKVDFLTYFYDCFYPIETPSNCNYMTPLSQLLAKLKWRKLDKITITNTYDNTIAKEFWFTDNNISTERLMLQSVQEKANTTTETINPYEFTYSDDTSISLPNYLKVHTDHWGFNNGITILNTHFNYVNYPTYGVNYRFPATDSKHYLEGTLSKIKYPTGGFTEFIFEPHTYSKEVKLNRSLGVDNYGVTKGAGGLRIKNIRSYDPASSSSVTEKTFYYVNGFNPVSPTNINLLISSGVLGGKTQYYWDDYKPQPDNTALTYLEKVFSTQSVLPSTENSLGSHIGYSEIVERPSSGGWVIHKFSNYDNGYVDDSFEGHLQVEATPYEPFNSKAFTRGKLLSKTDYFENGNPVSKMIYIYGALGSEHARSVRTDIKRACDTDNRIYEGTAYKIYTYKYKLMQEQMLMYHQTIPSAFVTQTTDYAYNAFGQVSEVKKSQSDGSQLISRMKHIPDYSDLLEPDCYAQAINLYGDCSNCQSQAEVDAWLAQINAYVASCTNVPYDQTSDAILKMKNKHIWSMVEELKYRKRGSTETIIGGNITRPKEYTFNLVNNFMPSLAYKLHHDNPLASTAVTFSNLNLSRNFIFDTKYKRPEIEFLKYNEAGNLLELIDYSNISTSYLWGYRNRLPIAEVRNMSYTDIDSELTTATINTLKTNVVTESVIRSTINNLRTSVDRKVTTYTHDVVYGLKSMTDPSNIPTYYTYDGLGRLKTLTDKDNNILKSHSYQYAGAVGGTGCLVPAPTITSAPASTGCNTVLTASACTGGTITWSNSQTGSSITVPSVVSPTYTATCTTTCTSSASNTLAGLNLPSGWSPVENGTGVNGCTVLGNNQIRMNAAPSGGIGGSDPDTYYFMDKQYSGNVTLIAKISSMSGTDNIRAGLMFRNSNNVKAPFFQIVQAGDNVVGKFYRNVENDDAKIWQYRTGLPAGAWLRIKKVGNNINSYFSTLPNPNIGNDGDWIEVLPTVLNPAPNITWGSNFLIGMSLTNAVGSVIPSAQVIWSSVQIDNNGVLETPFN
jgi:YD repeat-containing protein